MRRMSHILWDFSVLVVHCSTPTLLEKENPSLDLNGTMLVGSTQIPFERRELGSPGEGGTQQMFGLECVA